MRDDFELLREYTGHSSEEAFRVLVERHAGMVHGTALRILQDAALADEVAQAVFVLLARKASTLPAGVVLAGWLHQATRYIARGSLRAERRRQQHLRDLASMNDNENSAVWDQIKPNLDEAMARLGAADRDALVLRFLEGRSFAEVAQGLGTTEAAAKMRVGRALEKLRRSLSRQGVAVSVAALVPALNAHAATAAPAALLPQLGGAFLTSSAPPNLLSLVNEGVKLMALQKLKTTLILVTAALLLTGGVVTTWLFLPRDERLSVKTFEPMAGEWEGTYETRNDGPAGPRPQPVALSVRTSDQGRVCDIEMQLLDRNYRPVATFRFTHALNDTGERIITTDDPSINTMPIEGLVIESMHNSATREWRAGFHATGSNNANTTECRWSRLGDDLVIDRQDVTVTPQGASRMVSHLELRPRSNKPRTAFNALPRGSQIFDGVTFTVQRPVNIIGARAARARGQALARVSDPSIRGRGKSVHVLHTGDHGASATGDYIWRLVLYYADGGRERFDFAYDVHLRNYWRRTGDGPPTPSDPNTSLAWIGTSLESDRTGAELVVSRTTLENPRPNVDVIGADFVSLLGPSSAYVLGVTVSDEGPKPARAQRQLAPKAPLLTFVVQNGTGQPQPDAALDMEFRCDDFIVRLAQTRTDHAGRITIDVPTDLVRAVQYQARRPDGQVESGGLDVVGDEKEWPPQVVRLSE